MTITARGPKPPAILVLCISYHSDEDSIRLSREVMDSRNIQEFHLLIVDNSESSTLEKVLSDMVEAEGKVRVLASGRNRGYFGGAAYGLSEYLSKCKMPEWVVVCNADLHFEDCGFLDRLVEYGNMHKHAVIAPAIFSQASRRDQNPFMSVRPSTLRMRLYKQLFSTYLVGSLYSVLSVLKWKARGLGASMFGAAGETLGSTSTVPIEIYAPYGACIAFRRSYFEAGGTLRHGAFLYGEEIFVAETSRRLGLSVAYDPRLRVLHEEHKTTGYWPTRLMVSHMKQAATYCADTFF